MAKFILAKKFAANTNIVIKAGGRTGDQEIWSVSTTGAKNVWKVFAHLQKILMPYYL